MNNINVEETNDFPKKKLNYQDYINLIETKHLKKSLIAEDSIKPGDMLRIGYKIPEGDKERIQYYEGVVIACQNKTLSKTFTLRRNVQGIGIEQVFVLNSPKIASIIKKQSSKVRRAKLYFLRALKGKATRLKAIL